jgi:uncharacterized membrane protein
VGVKMQNRFKSKAAWISFFALLSFILKTYLQVEITQMDQLVELILITLTAFGVFNNPTDKNNY